MELKDKYRTLFNSYYLNTPLRIAHFMAQIHHESGLKPISENLNYSKEGLLNTFGKYFTDDIKNKDGEVIRIGTSSIYARKPEKIANKVYSNRMGNGDENSGEGWKYRGRGFLQITGKNNYIVLSKDTRIDFLNNPELLLEEPNALISALWYWNKHKLNELADKNDIKGITRSINGGYNGLEDRKKLFQKYFIS